MMPCTRGGKLLGTRLALSACGALLLVLAACADAAPTAEQTTGAEGSGGEAAAPFEGQTVEFVVPYEPGGGYDQYVRIIAPYLGDCLGADVIAVNEPGAGSLLATNQTAVAEPDGTRIQILNTIGAVSAQVAEEEGARYDLADFSWLARIAGEPNVLSVSANSDFQDFDDLTNAEEPVRFVATGPGSSEYVGATVLSEVYGFPAEVVTGFAGSEEAQLAVIQGEADAHILSLDSTLPAVESGDMRPLLVIGSESSDKLPDAPTVTESTPEDESQEAVLDSLVNLVETARSVAAPPDLPQDRLTALREGLACALENEEFVAEAEEQGRPIEPLTGEEMAALIEEVLDSPPEFQTLVRESF